MTSTSTRALVLGLVLGSYILLLPGILLPVLDIRGLLTKDGLTRVAPMMLEQGLNDDTIATLKKMMNPNVLAMLQLTGGTCARRSSTSSGRSSPRRCGREWARSRSTPRRAASSARSATSTMSAAGCRPR